MESSLQSDVWLNDSTTTARVDTQYQILCPGEGFPEARVERSGESQVLRITQTERVDI
jgi:hypothetical protein